MATAMNLFAAELAELEAHEKEMEEASGMIRSSVVVFAKHLAAIYQSGCWKPKYKNFDAYCEERWRFTGMRGRQIVSAAEVAKNLAAMTEEDRLGTYFFEYFTESHARVLKDLSPEDQRTVWQAATANGEPPTAKTLEAVKEEITPKDIYSMGKEEQHATLKNLEAFAEAGAMRQRSIEISALAMKRFRAVGEDVRDPKLNDTFAKGEYYVKGGVAGLVTKVQEEFKAIHGSLTAPLLEE